MANKERYTVAEVIAALQAARGMKAHAARRLGCHVDTISNYAKRHPTVAQAIVQAREEMLDTAEVALFDAVERGEAWAVCFLLKCRGTKRGYIEKVSLSDLDAHLDNTDEVARIWADMIEEDNSSASTAEGAGA